MKSYAVGEHRVVADNDDVRQCRCAGDALQLGVVDKLTDTNLRHSRRHIPMLFHEPISLNSNYVLTQPVRTKTRKIL